MLGNPLQIRQLYQQFKLFLPSTLLLSSHVMPLENLLLEILLSNNSTVSQSQTIFRDANRE